MINITQQSTYWTIQSTKTNTKSGREGGGRERGVMFT